MSLTYCGLEVTILPETVRVRRSWRERLLTLPWKPWIKTREVHNEMCPPRGEVWQVRGDLSVIWPNARLVPPRLIMSRSTYEDLKKDLPTEPLREVS